MHFCVGWVDPRGWFGHVDALTLLPSTGWGLHGESFVRADVVVLMAKGVQPVLMLRWFWQSAAAPCRLQGAVEPFYLALCLHPTD